MITRRVSCDIRFPETIISKFDFKMTYRYRKHIPRITFEMQSPMLNNSIPLCMFRRWTRRTLDA